MNRVPGACPLLSVVIVAYEHADEVRTCLQSLEQGGIDDLEILVIDNSPSSSVVGMIPQEYADVQFYREGFNDGYAGGNNRGLAYARGKYVLVLNPDTIVEQNALRELVHCVERHPGDLVTAKLLGGDGRINACGNEMHPTGITTCRGLGDAPEMWRGDVEVPLVSGAAVLAGRETWELLEGFDERYFLYMEDADLSLRARFLGRKVWCAADAVIFHNYALNLTPDKYYFLVRNRWMTIVKHWSAKALVQRLALMVAVEELTWIFALVKGPQFLSSEWRAYHWLWKNRRYLLEERAKARLIHTVREEEVWAWLDGGLPFAQLRNSGRSPLSRVQTEVKVS